MATTNNVTRIKAKDDAPKAEKPAETKASKPVKAKKAPKTGKKNILARIGGYFKGAWFELRQVRWPNRRATWGLTVAVIVFSLAFFGIIILLDTLFKFLFELIIT